MRIAFVSQWFPPEPGTVVVSSIVDGLIRLGHQVDVLTGFPNYPSGRLHPDYPLKLYRRDTYGGDTVVHRSPLFPNHSSDVAKRALNYLSFAAFSCHTALKHVHNIDAWLVYSSPATAALPAFLGARRRSAPVCLIVQDLWPDSVFQAEFVRRSPLARTLNSLVARFSQWTYQRADRLGVISHGMRSILIDRGIDADKIFFTPNGIDTSAFGGRNEPSDIRSQLGIPPDARVFLYAGNIGPLQNLEAIVEAFGECNGAHLVLIGDGIHREAIVRMAQRVANVTVLPPQTTDAVGSYLRGADVHVVSLRDSPMLRATMPSKVQVALALGKPILANAAGDVADLVTTAGCGTHADPGNASALREAIERMVSMPRSHLEAMSHRARVAYTHTYAPDAVADRIDRLLSGS